MKREHGTLRSYITGFVLSLIFTVIPYYLVVQKVLEGNVLLAAILGFAVLQLFVQVIFFLHLGRERNPRWQTGFLVATIGAIFVVVGGSIWIMSHLHYNMSPTDVANKVSEGEAVHQISGVQTGTCPGGTGVNHKVVLKAGTISPQHTEAKLCDTITIWNNDDATHEIKFGTHEELKTYAGEDGKAIRKGRSLLITLTETGTYQFHDHEHHELTGDFTVTP